MNLLCPKCHKFTIAGPVNSHLFCQCGQEEPRPMNTKCPLCQKPFWPYATMLIISWNNNVYRVSSLEMVPNNYCTGHPLYTYTQLEPEERTEVPKAFYDAFSEEGV